LALGVCSPVLVSSDMYEGTFAKKNRVRGLPAPPGAPPALGSLVWRAEGEGGLPSTRNWPFRWPLSPATHQPAPGGATQDPRQREPPGGRGGGFGGWSCTSAVTRGQRALLRFFNSSALVKRAVPRPSCGNTASRAELAIGPPVEQGSGAWVGPIGGADSRGEWPSRGRAQDAQPPETQKSLSRWL
jgi:hypothetical protein